MKRAGGNQREEKQACSKASLTLLCIPPALQCLHLQNREGSWNRGSFP